MVVQTDDANLKNGNTYREQEGNINDEEGQVGSVEPQRAHIPPTA